MRDVRASIRAALGASGNEPERIAAVKTRLSAPPGHPIPARATKPRKALIADFIARLQAQQASVERVAIRADAPGAAARYLADHGLPLRAAAAPSLRDLDWRAIDPAFRMPLEEDAVGLSQAHMGIAETGTLAIFSGPDDPATLAFVPETHILLLAERDIVGSFEALFAAQRRRFGDLPPRALCLLSGPSRTADIEQTIELGAHGPARLHVICYGPAS